jgi:hypothetical protein
MAPKDRINQVTGAFIHAYRPIRIYLYDWRRLPERSWNFLTRCLLFPGPNELNGAYLFERVDSVSRADYFLYPADVNWFNQRETMLLEQCLWLDRYEERHLFVDSRDNPVPLPLRAAVSLKVSVPRTLRAGRVVCIPYVDTVDDYYYYFHRREAFEYGASFVGQGTELRETLIRMIAANASFPTFFRTRRYGFLRKFLTADAPADTEQEIAEKRQARLEFLEASTRSRYILALPGFGVNTSRFFEAMSLGAAPILISDDAALPFEDRIPYEEFAFHIRTVSPDTHSTVIRLVEDHWDEATLRGKLARYHYDAYLSRSTLLFMLRARLHTMLWA